MSKIIYVQHKSCVIDNFVNNHFSEITFVGFKKNYNFMIWINYD